MTSPNMHVNKQMLNEVMTINKNIAKVSSCLVREYRLVRSVRYRPLGVYKVA